MDLWIIAAVLAVAAIGGAVVWYTRRMSRLKDRARWFNRYQAARSLVLSGDSDVDAAAIDHEAGVIVDKLGPMYDPRVSGWERLRLLEPRLREFVCRNIDTKREAPLDLECFAETLLWLEVGSFRGITPPEWLEAAKDFVRQAAGWRTLPRPTGKAMDAAVAVGEATEVARRLYAFGNLAWDRKRQIATSSW